MTVFHKILAVVLGLFVAIYAFGTLTGQYGGGGNALDYLLRVAYIALLFFGVYKLWPRAKVAESPGPDERVDPSG